MRRIITFKRAATLAPFTLIEVVLSVLVLLSLYLALSSMVNGMNYYQKFFARDNALLAETLHGAPNGKMQVAYLWSNSDYRLSLAKDTITVSLEKEGFRTNPAAKRFGTSSVVNIPDNSLTANSFAWNLERGQTRTLRIDETFSAYDECPKSTQLLTGLGVIGATQGFSQAQVDQEAQDAYERVRARLASRQIVLQPSGVSLIIYSVEGPSAPLAVYAAPGEFNSRFSCLLAKKLGVSAQTLSSAPVQNGDVVIVYTSPDWQQFTSVKEAIAQTVDSYTGGSTP